MMAFHYFHRVASALQPARFLAAKEFFHATALFHMLAAFTSVASAQHAANTRLLLKLYTLSA